MKMSKPRPFSQSLWGVALVLVATLVVLGINNYRGHLGGFDLVYKTVTAYPTSARTQIDKAFVIQSAAELDDLANLIEAVKINWDKQIAIAYFAHTQPTAGYKLAVDNVHREGTTISIRYQLLPPEDTKVARGKTNPGIIVILDRARLISSSDITINLLNSKQITHTLNLSPDQI